MPEAGGFWAAGCCWAEGAPRQAFPFTFVAMCILAMPAVAGAVCSSIDPLAQQYSKFCQNAAQWCAMYFAQAPDCWASSTQANQLRSTVCVSSSIIASSEDHTTGPWHQERMQANQN